MTAAALTAPDAPATAPPAPAGCGDGTQHDRHPAPLATMLAVLGRIASHAGGVRTMTITEPGQRVAVMTDDQATYWSWCTEVFGPDVQVVDDRTAGGTEGCLHGWSVAVYLGPAR